MSKGKISFEDYMTAFMVDVSSSNHQEEDALEAAYLLALMKSRKAIRLMYDNRKRGGYICSSNISENGHAFFWYSSSPSDRADFVWDIIGGHSWHGYTQHDTKKSKAMGVSLDFYNSRSTRFIK